MNYDNVKIVYKKNKIIITEIPPREELDLTRCDICFTTYETKHKFKHLRGRAHNKALNGWISI